MLANELNSVFVFFSRVGLHHVVYKDVQVGSEKVSNLVVVDLGEVLRCKDIALCSCSQMLLKSITQHLRWKDGRNDAGVSEKRASE